MKITTIFFYLTGITSILLSLRFFIDSFILQKKRKDSIPIKAEDIENRDSFLKRLKTERSPALGRVLHFLGEECRNIIDTWNPGENIDESQWEIIINKLNFILGECYFYDLETFKICPQECGQYREDDGEPAEGSLQERGQYRDIEPDGELKELLKKNPESMKPDELRLFNRILLENTFPELKRHFKENEVDFFERIFKNKVQAVIISLVMILAGIISISLYLDFVYLVSRIFSMFRVFESMSSRQILIHNIRFTIFASMFFYAKFSLIVCGFLGLFLPEKLLQILHNKRGRDFMMFVNFLLMIEGVNIIMMTYYLIVNPVSPVFW